MHGPGVLLLQDKEEKMTIDVHMLHIRSRALWTLAKQNRTGTGRPDASGEDWRRRKINSRRRNLALNGAAANCHMHARHMRGHMVVVVLHGAAAFKCFPGAGSQDLVLPVSSVPHAAPSTQIEYDTYDPTATKCDLARARVRPIYVHGQASCMHSAASLALRREENDDDDDDDYDESVGW